MAEYEAYLKDTRNGKTYKHIHKSQDDCDDNDAFYNWTEGNFSCDCNRAIFMYDDWEMQCNSGDNVIKLEKLINKDTGKLIWKHGQPKYFE